MKIETFFFNDQPLKQIHNISLGRQKTKTFGQREKKSKMKTNQKANTKEKREKKFGI